MSLTVILADTVLLCIQGGKSLVKQIKRLEAELEKLKDKLRNVSSDMKKAIETNIKLQEQEIHNLKKKVDPSE